MKYLIIGGCGFIGCNFAQKHSERGDEVIVMDNLSRKGATKNLHYMLENYPAIRFLYADIRMDIPKMQAMMEEVDVVYLLAGQVAVTTSVSNPREDFEINVLGTLNVLEAIRLSSKRPILIYSSTNKVYGGMEELEIINNGERYQYKHLPEGIKENQLLDFHSPYGCSKGAADQYVRDYSRIYDLKTVVMRQSCIYGKRQFGVEDQGWVAWFAIAAALGKDITIYGDGKQVRDVLYVDDLFEAWDKAVKKIHQTKGQIYNVGGGIQHSMSLLELIAYIEKFSGKSVPFTFANWRPGDQPVYISDITKIKIDLDWEPKISVEEGVETLYHWVLANQGLFSDF